MIAVTTASFVARETGYATHGWGHGDRLASEAFAPVETFGERLDELLADVRALGFDAVELWGGHLNPAWATDDHVAAAHDPVARHGLRVVTYSPWIEPAAVERACEIAAALGASVIGAGYSGDADQIVPSLERHGVRLAVENHAERTPAELCTKIDGGGDVFGATVDTGWWATRGYDAVRAIEELGARVLHVHLKDVRAVGEPHETCRWGEGIVPIRECVRALERLGYAGALSIEHEPEDHDPSEELRAMRVELEAWLS